MALVIRYSAGIASGVKSVGGPRDTSNTGVIQGITPLNSLFDKVLKTENITGSTEYRLIYICNEDGFTVYNPRVKLISTPQNTVISLGVLSKNIEPPVLASETSSPSAAFKTKDEINAMPNGYYNFPGTTQLGPGEYAGIWLKREVKGSTGSGTITEEFVLEIEYQN